MRAIEPDVTGPIVMNAWGSGGAMEEEEEASKPVLFDQFMAEATKLGLSERPREAVEAYGRALARRPDDAGALNLMGLTLEKLGRVGEALRCYQRAAGLATGRFAAICESNLLLALNYDQRTHPRALVEAHKAWAARHARRLQPTPRVYDDGAADRLRDASWRIRVGYVSADLRHHAGAAFLEPVVLAHDRERVEVICYSDVLKPDSVTNRVRAGVEGWRETGNLSDDQLAQLVAADRVDVLVEMTGHMGGNRLLTFARRPAPVQVTYPGYPNTTGMAVFDGLITDDDRVPEGGETFFTEPLARIPVSAQCYRPPPAKPAVCPDPPCRWNGFVTFASLNRLVKVTPLMMQTWGKVLRAVPMSRLAVLTEWRDDPSTEAEVRERFANAGIPVDRLDLVPRMRSKEYLAYYNRIDVLLDTSPYNGHTTTLDATWMGVPTVTLAGEMHAGREGLAILKHVGLEHLVARTPEEYVAVAVRLGSRRDDLTILRRDLRGRLAASPLCDGRRVAAVLERVYRELWQRWCNSMPKPSIR